MQFDLLDQGYIKIVESWGSDRRIVEAARMSTDKGFLGWGPICAVCNRPLPAPNLKCETPGCQGSHELKSGDEKLLRYLYTHRHMTPFEMAGCTIEVQAPIFVFREWHRHRTQSYNELSARYTELPNMFYMPSRARLEASKQSATNKQSSAAGFSADDADALQEMLRESYQASRKTYDLLLAIGVSREVARVVIPVAQYSRMRASANLRNWLQFLTLRMDPSAQWEIRQYADAMGHILQQLFPRTWELFTSVP